MDKAFADFATSMLCRVLPALTRLLENPGVSTEVDDVWYLLVKASRHPGPESKIQTMITSLPMLRTYHVSMSIKAWPLSFFWLYVDR